jgi:hypothetical protein
MALLASWEADWMKRWSQGEFTHVERFATAILNSKALGACETCRSVQSIEYSQLEELFNEE